MAAPKAHEMHETHADKASGKRSAPEKASQDIAEKAGEAIPKGTPSSDRHKTETAIEKD